MRKLLIVRLMTDHLGTSPRPSGVTVELLLALLGLLFYFPFWAWRGAASLVVLAIA